MQTVLAYCLSRLDFEVIFAGLIPDDQIMRMTNKVVSLGGKIRGSINSVYDHQWHTTRLIISDKGMHRSFCCKKPIKFADIGGNIETSESMLQEAESGEMTATIFKNLDLAPDWSYRLQTTKGTASWTQRQRALGFPAAAAAASFAMGHFKVTGQVVTFADLNPHSFNRYLRMLENNEPTWKGIGAGYDE